MNNDDFFPQRQIIRYNKSIIFLSKKSLKNIPELAFLILF